MQDKIDIIRAKLTDCISVRVAEKTGLSDQTINDFKNNKKKGYKFDTILKLAEYTGVRL